MATEWQTGTPADGDRFLIREVYVLEFLHPSGFWYMHGLLFKPDFVKKCFRAWTNKTITFSFDCEDMRWHKVMPSESMSDEEIRVPRKESDMKHSLNDTIKVKLTDYGKRIYSARIDTINAHYGKKVIKDNQPYVDAEGFSRFQLWDFMNIFGEYIYMSNTNIVIENLEFEFIN